MGDAFHVGDWSVDSASGRITRDGESVKLEPRVMEVLVYLASHQGEVVSRQELEETLWAGTVVSYEALTGAIQKLRRAFKDDRKAPRVIETLSKRGYRLVAPVYPLVAPEGHVRSTVGDTVPAKEVRWGQVAAIAALAALAVVAFFLWSVPKEEDAHLVADDGAKRSIAVLPFDSLSGDSSQDYFADGITDDLITGLAKRPDLLVIARDSTFLYKDQPVDVRDVAERLGVRYILNGSVRREGDRVRINTQLVDAKTGRHVWAETFDRDTREVFDLQKEITGQIVAALPAHTSPGSAPELEPPQTNSLPAYESFLLGRHLFYQYLNRDENRKARDYFRKAREYDPDFAMAYAMEAWTHAFDVMNGWSEDRETSLRKAHELADEATSLRKALPVAYFVKGLAHRELGDYVKALVEAEKAIEYDPNYANAHVLLATLLYYAGRPEEGLKRIQEAMQINPHHPYNYSFHLGQAFYILRRYPEAVDAFEQGIASNPASERLHVWQAAALAQTGALDDAAWEADQVLALNPGFSWERMQETFPFKSQEDREHFLDGLKKAGLAE
ncbi:MAG: winged helix-turn-helix domain-containing tetratricopeptide repeat protein [Gammaproteobacteria bacterium]|jgi:TolB-like protein/DNA-binding winged helix-turn-helix (wHTH) protein/Tfp pilus assembly protein PilF|nr:winged helix-turn-helix domain-containing tetratricopeptide repeat protein [Gammaproteobacteria bacterium]